MPLLHLPSILSVSSISLLIRLIGFLPGFFLQNSWIIGSNFLFVHQREVNVLLVALQQGDVGGVHVALHPTGDQGAGGVLEAFFGIDVLRQLFAGRDADARRRQWFRTGGCGKAEDDVEYPFAEPLVGSTSESSRLPDWSCYSITSSALANIEGGIDRPKAFAVFKLTARLNLVGCCTGRSAAFSPFKMRPTYVPALRKTSGKSAP